MLFGLVLFYCFILCAKNSTAINKHTKKNGQVETERDEPGNVEGIKIIFHPVYCSQRINSLDETRENEDNPDKDPEDISEYFHNPSLLIQDRAADTKFRG